MDPKSAAAAAASGDSSILGSIAGFAGGWIWYMISWLVTLVLWVAGAALFGVWWCQGLLLYLPNSGTTPKRRGVAFNPQGYRSPEEYRMSYEDVFIRATDQVRIHAWFIKQSDERLGKAPTLVLFHGNAGNIGFRLPLFRKLYDALGCNILCVQYRGYGNSEGTPSEAGLSRDAQVAVEWLMARRDIDVARIFLYGQSLGGAVAIKTAQLFQNRLCGVMVENTFTSIDDMVIELGTHQFKLDWIGNLRLFFAYFLTSHWHSLRTIQEVRTPLLFLSGLRDELIPPAHMQALHDASRMSSLRRLVPFPTGSHNDTHYRGGELYFRAMATFMTDALRVTGVFEPSMPASASSSGHASSLASGGGVKSPRADDA